MLYHCGIIKHGAISTLSQDLVMPTIPEEAAAMIKEFGDSSPQEAKNRAAACVRGGDRVGAQRWKQIAFAAQRQVDEKRHKQRSKL